MNRANLAKLILLGILVILFWSCNGDERESGGGGGSDTLANVGFNEPVAEDIVIIGWNVQSGGAQVSGFSDRLTEFNDIDVWGFSEVPHSNWAQPIEDAIEVDETSDYAHILGNSGRGDRLMIVYNSNKFTLLGSEEIDNINTTGNARAPLVALYNPMPLALSSSSW